MATSEAIDYLCKPAPAKWVAGRVATLLASYAQGNRTDEALATAVADDWLAILSEYPAWAIAKACRWWMSMDNPKRGFKPVPGDIQERAHRELEPIRAAKIMVSMGAKGV